MDVPGNSFSLFVLYLVISGNFLAPLFSCRLRQFIENSMVVRHILGFLTLTFFVVVATKSAPMTYAAVLGLSGLFYGWFLMTTRMSLNFWFLVITLLGSVYLIHLYQSDLTSDKPTPQQEEVFNMLKKAFTGLLQHLRCLASWLITARSALSMGRNSAMRSSSWAFRHARESRLTWDSLTPSGESSGISGLH